MKPLTLALLALALLPTGLWAQRSDDVVWVQVEAQPSLSEAEDRARDYAARLPDVVGFALGGRWYGILLGPYLRSDAEQVLRVYRAERQIPSDAYIVNTRALRRQYWPPGEDLLERGALQVPSPDVQSQSLAPAETRPDTRIETDETPRQARQSEQALTRDERKALQTALRWAGFYRASIDGAFGAGTRRSMSDWQRANGFDPTGILTTRQRQQLMDAYNAPLISAGMAPVRDTKAGISMDLPLGLVRFGEYAAPFARYDSVSSSGVQALVISQPGNRNTLGGIYEIIQTLDIVPLNGPRNLSDDRFVIEGQNNSVITHVEASLEQGEIKGFALVWPLGDDERRGRVLAAMQQSFDRLPGVLDPATGAEQPQDIERVAGLRVRKPKLSRSGFFVNGNGTVVTTIEAIQSCGRITLDGSFDARVIALDEETGIAVLRPVDALAPLAVATIASDTPRLQSEIAVSGYSFEGVLGAPTTTFGTFADVKGLRGEPQLDRLELRVEAGDAGGPVVNGRGEVVGMLLPAASGAQRLPEAVRLSADADAVRAVIAAAGLPAPSTSISSGTTTARPLLDPVTMGRRASAMTVLVSCWD